MHASERGPIAAGPEGGGASSAGEAPNGALPLPEVRRRLLEHYDLHHRKLPWRSESDPYRIWISEVMLQQTRVETVIPYYRRWMERFPDIEALASADEDDVLGLWEGLGYYARARNLHRAARVIRDRHGGELPRELAPLGELPGFGSYTAGAVASIAFGAPVPAVDGNVRRVLSRLLDLAAPSAARLAEVAGGLVAPERPGDFNQALMELGATICTPRSPKCDACPLRPECLAALRGTAHERPARPPRRPVPERAFVVLALVDSARRTLLVRRPRGGLLGGMWAFPERELAEGWRGDDVRSAAAELARQQLPANASSLPDGSDLAPLPEVRHAFTHLRATYLPWILRCDFPAPAGERDVGRRRVPASAPGVALPAAQKRILAMLEQRVGGATAGSAPSGAR